LRGRYLADSNEEVVHILDIYGGHELLDDAVDNTNHLSMLALLAFPDQLHGILWKGPLLSEELKNTATSLDDFDVSVLTEDDI
jgi:hypothetical protein